MRKIWTGFFAVAFYLLFYNQFIDQLDLLKTIKYASVFLIYWHVVLLISELLTKKPKIWLRLEYLAIRAAIVLGLVVTKNSVWPEYPYLNKGQFSAGLIIFALGLIYFVIYEDEHKNDPN